MLHLIQLLPLSTGCGDASADALKTVVTAVRAGSAIDKLVEKQADSFHTDDDALEALKDETNTQYVEFGPNAQQTHLNAQQLGAIKYLFGDMANTNAQIARQFSSIVQKSTFKTNRAAELCARLAIGGSDYGVLTNEQASNWVFYLENFMTRAQQEAISSIPEEERRLSEGCRRIDESLETRMTCSADGISISSDVSRTCREGPVVMLGTALNEWKELYKPSRRLLSSVSAGSLLYDRTFEIPPSLNYVATKLNFDATFQRYFGHLAIVLPRLDDTLDVCDYKGCIPLKETDTSRYDILQPTADADWKRVHQSFEHVLQHEHTSIDLNNMTEVWNYAQHIAHAAVDEDTDNAIVNAIVNAVHWLYPISSAELKVPAHSTTYICSALIVRAMQHAGVYSSKLHPQECTLFDVLDMWPWGETYPNDQTCMTSRRLQEATGSFVQTCDDTTSISLQFTDTLPQSCYEKMRAASVSGVVPQLSTCTTLLYGAIVYPTKYEFDLAADTGYCNTYRDNYGFLATPSCSLSYLNAGYLMCKRLLNGEVDGPPNFKCVLLGSLNETCVVTQMGVNRSLLPFVEYDIIDRQCMSAPAAPPAAPPPSAPSTWIVLLMLLGPFLLLVFRLMRFALK